jgi:hypothetical protein
VPQDDDNITQRNVQFSSLESFIRNATDQTGSSSLRLEMGTFPMADPAWFDFLVEDPDGSLAALWSGTPGISVSQSGGFAVVRVHAGVVTLPVFDMPPVSARASRAEYNLPLDAGQHAIILRHILNGEEVGGMQFILTAQSSPR